ncbi:protein split ends-like [Teratosphaeria destructans]|uniref:Protein split ends-like n=1 Tax=Teratosphaeria destructans TaxID=418781 RepID=A0A9W7W500_9PEZI|nr:protein split ends-like [Teratosphaeria destructans]
MATAEVGVRPREHHPSKRGPLMTWMRKINPLGKNNDNDSELRHEKKQKKKGGSKHNKKNSAQNDGVRNNPYPESGPLRQRDHSPASSVNGHLSFATPSSRRVNGDNSSFDGSIAHSALGDREGPSNSNKSGAPTLATNAETVHSDAGHSKAATATTGAGALSMDALEPIRSLTTTLTTIQSQSANSTLQQNGASTNAPSHGNQTPVMFSHQYPTSPAPSAMTASAIPRHVAETMPNSYNAATANNLLTDNASILTLASSSKRRRRSMDTDASVRAIPPSSVWGGSRESLPLSVLSGNADDRFGGSTGIAFSQSRPSMGGLASAERASVYSSQGASAPALASERNSYYSHRPGKDLGDAKSLRSITNVDARSQYDSKSINQFDARSINETKSMDVNSLRNYESSVRSGAVGHTRQDSIPNSISSPLASPWPRHPNNSGFLSSRRSTDWHDTREEDQEEEEEDDDDDDDDEVEVERAQHLVGGAVQRPDAAVAEVEPALA